MQYFVDGKYVEHKEAVVSIDDRGYYFGDGVYEVIKMYNGQYFTLDEHLNRLFRSAAEVQISLPYSKEELIEVANELMKRNAIFDGYIYLQVTRGVDVRQHQFPTKLVRPVVTAYAVPVERPIEDMQRGMKVITTADIRWLRCDIKSLNLLGSVLAKQEAVEAGAVEAMLHRDGVVTEGASTNMFAVKDGVIYTHPANHLILNGITRQVVISLCEELNIPIKEEPFTITEAYVMDELFFTSTNVEVMPIIELDGQAINNGQIGHITKILQQAFQRKLPLQLEAEKV